jgi:hypothetical protein
VLGDSFAQSDVILPGGVKNGNGATSGQVLQWNGSAWLPATSTAPLVTKQGLSRSVDTVFLGSLYTFGGAIIPNVTNERAIISKGFSGNTNWGGIFLNDIGWNTPFRSVASVDSASFVAAVNTGLGSAAPANSSFIDQYRNTIAIGARGTLTGRYTYFNVTGNAIQARSYNGTKFSETLVQDTITRLRSFDGSTENQLNVYPTYSRLLRRIDYISDLSATYNANTLVQKSYVDNHPVSVSARLSGAGTVASPLDLAQQSASTGQVLAWSGTSWLPSTSSANLSTKQGLSRSVDTVFLGRTYTYGDPTTPNVTNERAIISKGFSGSTNWGGIFLNDNGWDQTFRSVAAGDSATFVDALNNGSLYGASPLNSSYIEQYKNQVHILAKGDDADRWSSLYVDGLSAALNSETGSSFQRSTIEATDTAAITTARYFSTINQFKVFPTYSASDKRIDYPSDLSAQYNNNTLVQKSYVDNHPVSVSARLSGAGTVASPLDLAQQSASTGQVLAWNGTTWSPANQTTGISTVGAFQTSNTSAGLSISGTDIRLHHATLLTAGGISLSDQFIGKGTKTFTKDAGGIAIPIVSQNSAAAFDDDAVAFHHVLGSTVASVLKTTIVGGSVSGGTVTTLSNMDEDGTIRNAFEITPKNSFRTNGFINRRTQNVGASFSAIAITNRASAYNFQTAAGALTLPDPTTLDEGEEVEWKVTFTTGSDATINTAAAGSEFWANGSGSAIASISLTAGVKSGKLVVTSIGGTNYWLNSVYN